MANAKKENKEEIKIEIGKSEEEIDQSKIIEDLQKQIEEMRKAFVTLQSEKSSYNKGLEEDDMFEIGTRFVNGVTIFSPRREVEKELPFNKNIELDKYELDMLLKSNYVRDWLEKDILFFTNEDIYVKKKIRKQFDLSDGYFIDLILKNSTNIVIRELSNMTKNYKDDPMIHCVFYRIVELCSNGKLSTMPHETRKAVEKAFNFKIDDAQMLFRGFKEVK